MSNKRSTPRFLDIKAILDSLVAGCDRQRMRDKHHEPNFGWDTLDQLKRVVVRPDGPLGKSYCLIDPALVAQKKGEETNLVKALRDRQGVDGYGKMPYSPPPGRYASPEEIQAIIEWLNAGMPE
jgi:hypothetical protein